jgi:hypothetical protein
MRIQQVQARHLSRHLWAGDELVGPGYHLRLLEMV